jgi:putative copper export protein
VTTGTQTLYDWLLFLHVLAAMVWVGGGVMLALLAAHVVRDPNPGAVVRFTASLRVLGPLVLAPATVAVLGLGT